MDTILDRNGNKLQVTMYCYPAKMWVLSDINDVPVACSAISRVNGVGFEWEDEQYDGYELLRNLHELKSVGKFKIKDKEFILYYHEADYFVGVTYPGNMVTGCVAIKDEGEMFCRWRSHLMRGSETSLAWGICAYSKVLGIKYLSRGITKLFGFIAMDNIASNQYHLNVGAKVVGTTPMMNKYEQDISDSVKHAELFRKIWEDHDIGDFDNPSILIQDEVYVG